MEHIKVLLKTTGWPRYIGRLFLLITCGVSMSIAHAQCPVGDLTLGTQTDIDNFDDNYSGCDWSTYTGHLIIDDGATGDITNLIGLSCITGDFGGRLTIQNTTALSSTVGLHNITSVDGVISILDNSALTDLSGFCDVSSVGGNLVLRDNTALKDLSGFESISVIGGALILDNLGITNVDGLSSLSTIGQRLTIRGNSNLENVKGLINLSSMNGEFRVIDNDALTSLVGLDNITDIQNILTINGNAQLSTCHVASVCQAIASSTIPSVNIGGNTGDCASQAAITGACGRERTNGGCNAGTWFESIEPDGTVITSLADLGLSTPQNPVFDQVSFHFYSATAPDNKGALVAQFTNVLSETPLVLDDRNFCNFKEQRFVVSVESGSWSCWLDMELHSKRSKMISNFSADIWCIDPLVSRTPDFNDERWYTDVKPYTYFPTIRSCEKTIEVTRDADTDGDGKVSAAEAMVYYTDRLEAADCDLEYQDWVFGYNCDDPTNPLSKLIVREWSYTDRHGNRQSVSDSIRVYKLPELTEDNFVSPAKDTVRCVYDTIPTEGGEPTFAAWKVSIPNHVDGGSGANTRFYYPRNTIDMLVDQVNAGGNDAQVLRTVITSYPLIKRTESAGPDITVLNMPSVGYIDSAGYYYVQMGAAQRNGSAAIAVGDSILVDLGGGRYGYAPVTSDFLWTDGAPQVWLDLALPTGIRTSGYTVVDRWSGRNADCLDGVAIKLWDRPIGTPDTCQVFCLTEEALDQTKCFLTMWEKDGFSHSGCDAVTLTSFGLFSNCSYDGSQAGINTNDSTSASGVNFADCEPSIDPADNAATLDANGKWNIERWTYFIDSLPPIVNHDANTITLRIEDGKDCRTEVTIPQICAVDNCSGVKAVKATLADVNTGVRLSGFSFEELVYNDSTQKWEDDPDDDFLVGPGTYLILYEAVDSCHNSITVTVDTLRVVDGQDPQIEGRNVNSTLTDCDEVIWVPISSLHTQPTDHCSDVCLVLGRRVDWQTACSADLCADGMAGVTDSAGLAAFLAEASLDTIFDNNIPSEMALYHETANVTYKSILNGDRPCGSPEVTAILRDGWEFGLLDWWSQNCVDNPFFIPTPEANIGGGWTTMIPVCEQDLCESGVVTVELIAFDRAGNYSAIVNAQVTVSGPDTCDCGIKLEGIDGEDLSMTCGAYNRSGIRGLVQACSTGDCVGLDAVLGEPQRVDSIAAGVVVSPSPLRSSDTISYEDQVTDFDTLISSVGEDSVIVDWDTIARVARLPVYCAPCELSFTQTVDTTMFNNCVGVVKRTWTSDAVSDCDGDSLAPGAVVLTQVINLRLEEAKLSWLNLIDSVEATYCVSREEFFEIIRNTGTSRNDLFTSGGQLNDLAAQMNIVSDLSAVEPLEVDFAEGSCVDYMEDTYTDNNGVSIVLGGNTGTDTVGIRMFRIYEYNARCIGGVGNFTVDEDTTIVTLFLDTSDAACAGITPRNLMAFGGSVSGLVSEAFSSSRAVGQVAVEALMLDGSTERIMADQNGRYVLDIPQGESVLIRPVKNINPTNGVDLSDIVLLHQYVLNRRDIPTEWDQVAADINNDGRINALDVIILQQLTLGMLDHFPGNTSWRFFNEETGEEAYTIPQVERGMEVNFLGVKIGDIDRNGTDLSRSRAGLLLRSKDITLSSGTQYTVSLESEQPLSAYQFSIRYDAKKVDVTDIRHHGLTKDNWYKVRDGEIRVTYVGELIHEIELDLAVAEGADLSEVIRITSPPAFENIVYTGQDGVMRAELSFADKDDFELLQNVPNPASDRTMISFILPEDAKANLKFFDVSGKLLRQMNGYYLQGLNTINIETTELGSNGVVYYQLETDQFSATKKMVLLK